MYIICMCECGGAAPRLAFLYPCMGIYGYICACIMGGWGACTYVRAAVIKNTDPENRIQYACTHASRIILIRVRNILAYKFYYTTEK